MQNENLTINEIMDMSLKLAENQKKQIKLTTDLSARIKKNLSTKKILYDENREAFDYVGKLFPDIDVSSIDVRQASPFLLKKLGYDGIGGFFERVSKTIIISAHQLATLDFNRCSVRAKLNKDEVIVHELLHYCHDAIGSSPSVNLKEEFAYGWSLGYLRNKGYSDEDIIKDNYLPYLYKVCYKDGYFDVLRSEGVSYDSLRKSSRIAQNRILNRLKNKIHKRVQELAIEKGREIIRIYNKKLKDGDVYRDVDKSQNLFNILDFD